MDKKLLELIKTEKQLDISFLKKLFDFEQLKQESKQIIMSDEMLTLAQENDLFRSNLLLLINYLLTVELNQIQKKQREASLKTKSFSDEFINRLSSIL